MVARDRKYVVNCNALTRTRITGSLLFVSSSMLLQRVAAHISVLITTYIYFTDSTQNLL